MSGTTATTLDPARPRSTATTALIGIALAGGAVAVALGVYAKNHQPTGELIAHFGFSSTLAMKAWLATAAFALAIVQALSAAWMWGRLPRAGAAPKWVSHAHRWTGTLAFVISLPVAYHCLWSLGWRDTSTRTIVHGTLGCAFYGAVTTKLLALRLKRAPGWVLPVAGGLLVALLTGLWLTSALWFFNTSGVRF
jgi:Family of unknown function (DUF6529)